MSAGPGLIVLNSRILNDFHFPYPALVSSFGLLATSVIVHSLSWSGQIRIERKFTLHFFYVRILPIALLSSATIVLGNIVYLHLSIAFIQMLKALTPVYILLCMFAFRLESPSIKLVASVVVLSCGTSIASAGEIHFSALGFVLQSIADVTEGLKLVLQDLLLKHLRLSPVETLYFVAPASGAIQLLYVAAMEPGGLARGTFGELLSRHGLAVAFVAITGFFVNVLGFLVMQRTNGLILKLLSILRSNALVVISFLFVPGNDVTLLQWTGYGISMLGFLWYTRLKSVAVPSAWPKSKIEAAEEDLEKIAPSV